MLVVIITVFNSTTGSSLAANISPYIRKLWNIDDTNLFILPTSIYLVGYVVGPLVWGPLSEEVGRKYVMVAAFTIYTLAVLASALAPNFAALVIFRLISGVGAACPITVCGGVCADLYYTPQSRGRAMAVFMAVTTFGPTAGPIISGYISPISWRWSFWVGLIFAGVTVVPLALIPETYGPKILKNRAVKLRKETQNENLRAPSEINKSSFRHIVTVVLTRPLRMFFHEPLVFFTCIYLSFSYSIFYMFFQSFPIIYEDIYGFSAGEEGLTFLAIGVGALIACAIYLVWDAIIRRALSRDAPWSRREESRRLPLACFGGPFIVIACFWLAWTSRNSIHWIVPVLSGLPFGIGFLLLFMALLNYLVDAYKIFAASAMAAAGTSRSIWGACLPFAAKPMYAKLGVAWACSLLGFLSLALAVIPFVFYWKGQQLRARSKFCQYLLQKEKEDEERRGQSGSRAIPTEDCVAEEKEMKA
jgi:multidrug resistance protein